MKKFMFLLLLIVISNPVYAGMGISRNFTYYETLNNLCYVSKAEVKKNNELNDGVIRNIAIINLSTNATRYIFRDEFNEYIEDMFFETEFRSSEKNIGFNNRDNYYNGNSYIRNNENITVRPIKDKLCILTYSPLTKKYSLWFCNKFGEGLKRVKSFNRDTTWWIDIRNSKVYFISQVANSIQCESIEW